MKPQLVVFDLAGTTVKDNQDVPRTLQQSLATHEITVPIASASRLMGIPKPVAIKALIKESNPSQPVEEKMVDEIHRTFISSMIRFYEEDPTVDEKVGVSEILSLLKSNGVKVVMDTGFDRATTDPLIKRMKWLDKNLIDGSVTSDEVTNGRPFPDMIYHAMKLTHVTDCKQVAKVGDTQSDMLEGTNAGCGWVIGVTTGAYSRQELIKEPHTHLIEQVLELKEIFGLS